MWIRELEVAFRRGRRGVRSALPAVAFLLLGLAAAFHPVLRSGLARIPGDRSDTIHLHFVIEHVWLWLSGGVAAGSFWDAPIGHPLAGTLAHGDLMLGFSPLYAPWRALGATPERAWALFVLVAVSLDYVATWLLLRRVFRADALAASLGAWLFAFSNARLAQLGHPQLLPQLFVLGAFASVCLFFARDASPARQRVAIAGYATCLLLQLWSGFYVGYFMALISAVALACALLLDDTRARVLERVRCRAGGLVAAVLVSAMLLAPLAIRYLDARAASRRVGVGAGELRLPRLASYLYMGPENVLYGWTARWPVFSGLPEAHEQAIGLGLVTTGVLLVVAWRRRGEPSVRLAALVIAVLLVALTWFPFGVRLWRLWYYTIPGLGAVRAVSRIGIFLALPAAIALACFVRDARLRGRGPALMALAIALVCGAEQLRRVPSYDGVRWACEVERLVEVIPPEAAAFHLMGDRFDGLQALAVAQRSGVPTVNFVGGAFPKEWTLFEAQVRDGGRDPGALRAARLRFLVEHGVDPDTVVEIDPEAIRAGCAASGARG